MDALLAELRQADLTIIVIAFLVGEAVGITGVVKDHILLKAHGLNVSWYYLFQLYHVGMFFNNFLPSSVGGDVIRSYELGIKIKNPALSLAVMFVERFTGFIVLMAFGSIAFLTNLVRINNPVLALSAVSASVGLLTVAWATLDSRLLNLIDRLFPLLIVTRITSKLRKFQNAVYSFREYPWALFWSFAWSVIFYLGAILYVSIMTTAFFAVFNVSDMVFLVPITMVVALMPITVNGIGLQEWTYMLMFPIIGISPSVALSVILMIRTFTLLRSLVGGVFYLQFRSSRPQREMPSANLLK
jgi:uncharacterized protein (TIRG00374 family)